MIHLMFSTSQTIGKKKKEAGFWTEEREMGKDFHLIISYSKQQEYK